jgi:hypothetical protein
MAEPASKYVDFADEYPAKYEISEDFTSFPRQNLVIRPLVVDPNLFDIGDDAGKIPRITINDTDKTVAELSGWDESGAIDVLIGKTLKNGIRVPEVPKVKNYLSNFPELIEILPSVCKVTREKFPSDKAQLYLEVTKDFSEDTEFLILYVRQEQYDENIMEIIDDIRSTYGEKLIGKQGWLLVTTDFCPPE